MRITSIIAAGAAAALLLTPAAALAGGPTTEHPGKGKAKREARGRPARRPRPGPRPPRRAGQGLRQALPGAEQEARQGPEGHALQPVRPCHGQDRLGQGQEPEAACKALSKKHRKGKKGTPFSRCVKAARKLRRREGERTGGDESYADPFASVLHLRAGASVSR